VGGADNVNLQNLGNEVTLDNCTVSGNRVTAQHAYGGGVFTLAGGPTNRAWMKITNCTIARNLAEDNPNIPEVGQYYYRGGGIYMGGGSLSVVSSTVAENEVNGNFAMFSGKSNMGGGGIASTIGDAHVVEDLIVQHSIVAGNKMNGASADYFAGSLLNFYSYGYNRFGSMDFAQILVPVPDWTDMSRKHYPKTGDHDGVLASQVLALDEIQYRSSIVSAGTDAGQPAVIWYPPIGTALDQIPSSAYNVQYVSLGYTGFGSSTDDFLNHLLENLRTTHGEVLGSDFGAGFGDLTGTTFYGPAQTWPSNPQNAAWIKFWRDLDIAINGRLGTAGLNDDYWGAFPAGQVGNTRVTVLLKSNSVQLVTTDQRGKARSAGQLGDIGAIER
jgi:hypothetical protein